LDGDWPRVNPGLQLLNGLAAWEWVGILLARGVVGLLFLLSGTGKLFRVQGRQRMVETLRGAGIPFPELNALLVSTVEFVFGALLLLGALTPLACVMLSGVMVVALVTARIPGIQARSVTGWLGEFLYLPELLYLVLLIWLFFAGPGWFSVDRCLIQGASA
jgi:putative oxidoreductase